jgi:enterochelin esterase-like enzyme
MREITRFWTRVPAIGHRYRAVTTIVWACGLCLLVNALVGDQLTNWIVALGMDDARAMLIASMLVVAIAGGVATLPAARSSAARLGAVAGFVVVEVIPFLLNAAQTKTTPGLIASANTAEWILQPLGILLLGALSVTVGVAIAQRLRRDVQRLAAAVRPRRWSWPLVPIAAALVVVVAASAVVGLQEGPLVQLHTYGPPNDPSTTGITAGAGPTWSSELQLPGHIEDRTVGGRAVLVYVPGVYSVDPTLRLPVVYFLHGTPGAPQDWLGSGGQLEGVLAQLIAQGEVPPLIGVAPDGNGPRGQDTEWGNSAQGEVESWLVERVVPFIDSQYRTLGAPYRGIAGLSSGGFGAVNLAFRHPAVFRWAASYSGYFSARPDIFGSRWPANSPRLTAASLPTALRMPLYLGWGAQDRGFALATVQFVSLVRRLHWPAVDSNEVPGGHGWQAWQPELVNSLLWLGRLWGPQPWGASTAAPRIPSTPPQMRSTP